MKMEKFLIASILSLGLALSASASTLVRPYGPSDYAGGAKAVGTKINSEFQNIVAWLNGQNISSSNIAPFGITSTAIASQAVTADKIYPNSIGSSQIGVPGVNTGNIYDASITTSKFASGAITRAVLPAANYAISANVTSFVSSSTNSASPDQTGLSASVTTTGAGTRPVRIQMISGSNSNGLGKEGFLRLSSTVTNGNSIIAYILLYKDGVEYQRAQIAIGAENQAGGNQPILRLAPSEVTFIDTAPGAGAHTYDLRFATAAANTSIILNYVTLFVAEL